MGLRHLQCERLAGAKKYLERTQVDFVAVQEATFAKVEVVDAEQIARNSGWVTAVGPCAITVADGQSAGVAMCGRTHVGMKNSISNEAWPKLLNEKFMLKHVAAVCRGGVHMHSCYLTSNDQRNLDTLQLMAGCSTA